MNQFYKISKTEFIHLLRSPFKVVALILFVLAAIYGCQNGYDLYKKHHNEILSIKADNIKAINKMVLKYEELDQGIGERSRRDPSVPYWAIWSIPSYVFKYPSPMMFFSIGQAEQYGFYKRVTNWSTVFDSDLAEEIANPERLAIGTLDFNFVLIYLCPILMIILLFNIGGFEKDLRFDNLIYLSGISKRSWLLSRFSFYFICLYILILTLLVPYAFLTGVFQFDTLRFTNLLMIISLYLLFWFTIFYFINLYGNGSSDQAIKMISLWMALCIIVPGTIHQVTSFKHPLNYMTDYLDVVRDESDKIFELSIDTLNVSLLKEFPGLNNTVSASDIKLDKKIINRSLSALVNIQNKKIAYIVEESSDKKNNFINSFYKLNPVVYFQNVISGISKTDYYAYKKYRSQIQNMIDKKINLILKETWNKVRVNKEMYIKYTESL